MAIPKQPQFGMTAGVAGGGFNRLAAGAKHYGGGRLTPNQGKTTDKAGYNQRDVLAKARQEALRRRAGGK